MMRMSTGRSLLVTCVASALLTLASSHAPATAQSETSRAVSQPPRLRLGDAARPVRYRLDLTLNPAEEKFHGVVDIDLEVSRTIPVLWLNASGLEINAAVITCGATSTPARTVPGGAEFVGFNTGGEIEPGPAHLHLEYAGVVSASGARGLFRRREGGDWYIYTQFEPTKARYAVPCFDEPSYKTPWQLTLHVPQSNLALSNTRIISETSEGSALRRVVFAETPPLPSYLVAAAIGPFDVVDAGHVGAKAVPVRIIALHGRGQEAGYAAEAAPEALRRLEAYFGIPYPYEKLDLVAVPQFWQAMENAGLVTFEQNGLLAPPDRQTIAFRQALAGVCAHELAHQWFGDLVTTAWWNDLWLNEGFATWMSGKIVDEWHPEWRSLLSSVVEGDEFAKGNDSLVTARSIRQPIETPDDIYNAFDGITYFKGAAVLRMFEQWIGPEQFRDGVRRYLRQHASASATSEDFIAALSQAAGQDLTPMLRAFLERPGLPLLTAELRHTGTGVVLHLTQTRYLPAGSAGTTGSAPEIWQIPVQVKYDGAESGPIKVLMTGASLDIPLNTGRKTPRWVLVNAGQIGYYRVRYTGTMLAELVRPRGKALTPAERVGVVADLTALVHSGAVPISTELALAPTLLQDETRQVTQVSLAMLGGIRNWLPVEQKPLYQSFVRRTFGPRARKIGWIAHNNDSDDVRLLRSQLLTQVAIEGEDPELTAKASQMTQAWLRDRHSLEPELASAVLHVAVRSGDTALFEQLRQAAREAEDPAERGRLLTAMGGFRDRATATAAYNLVLTNEFNVDEALIILLEAGHEPDTRGLAFDFIKHHYDALAARVPANWMPALISTADGFADETHRHDVEHFFAGRAAKIEGGPRTLAQVLEQIHLNTALAEAQLPSLRTFLARQKH